MIERLLFTALNDGIDDLTANPKRLLRLFENLHEMTTAEATSIRTYFLAKRPMVLHNYPRTDETHFPAFIIVMSDERESQKFLNDEGGIINADDADFLGEPALFNSKIITSLFQYEFTIYVASERPDITLYYYQLAKYFLRRKLDFFKENGVLDFTMSGSDFAPDLKYMPTYLFIRRLTINCLAEEPILGDSVGGRIRSVDGIFVSGGSDSDMGEVLTNVTTSE